MTDRYFIKNESDKQQVLMMRNNYLQFICNKLLGQPNTEKILAECLDVVDRYQSYLNEYNS